MIASYKAGGFSLTFENGLTIRVVFGIHDAGSNNYKDEIHSRMIRGREAIEANTAELCIWDALGTTYDFPSNKNTSHQCGITFLGYVGAEGVADWIAAVKEATSLADIKEPQTEY